MSKDAMYVCAEMGVNWNGDRDLLIKMVKEAIDCEVDGIKLQMFNEDTIKDYPEELKKRLSTMLIDDFDILDVASLCHKSQVDLVVTPMYPKAIEILKGLPVDGIKIRAKDWWKDEFIEPLRGTDKAVYISVPYRAGEMYVDDIPEAMRDRLPEFLARTRGRNRYRVYCLNDYPPMKQFMSLNLVENFDGCSLHSPDWWDSYAAACINIQKQYVRGDKRRFYIEAHMMPIVYTGNDVHIAWARGILGRESFIDGAVSLTQDDIKKLAKACDELEETIG